MRWENRFKGDTGEQCLTYTDGTDFQTNFGFDKKWYSHKFKKPAVKYELTSCIKTGDIVAFNGPFRGGMDDISIFRFGLRKALAPGELVMADKGYSGDTKTFTPDDVEDDDDYEDEDDNPTRIVMKRIGMRHETINSRLKQWQAALKKVWRHSVAKHHLAFRSIVVLTQLLHENGHPFYDVKGKSSLLFLYSCQLLRLDVDSCLSLSLIALI
jgi:hypothetical protein